MNATLKALFPLGQIVSTPGAVRALMDEGCGTTDLLVRHVSGDWGDLDSEDRKENDFAVPRSLRILSSYRLTRTNVRIWVITEADRSVTTLLLPEEY
jgi:hypothetical protein